MVRGFGSGIDHVALNSSNKRKSRRARTILAASVLAVPVGFAITTPVIAATKWWDTNGTGTGATSSTAFTAPGTWDTGVAANWTTTSTGTAASTTWTTGDDAVFSAGTNATAAFTVTIATATTVTAASVSVEEGQITWGPGSLALSGAGGTFSVATGSSGSFSLGFLAGTVGLTKIGGGALDLGGNENYSGTTTINAGTILLASGATASPFGTTAAIIVNGGSISTRAATSATLKSGYTVSLGTSGGTFGSVSAQALTIAAKITGAGTFKKGIGGTVNLTATTSDFSGGIEISSGVLAVGGPTNLGPATQTITFTAAGTSPTLSYSGTGAFALGAARVISIPSGDQANLQASSSTASFTIAGQITGAGIFRINSTTAGTFIISNTGNDYTGGTTLDGTATAVTKIAVDNALSSASTLTMVAGTFDLNGFNQQVTALIGTAGTIVNNGGNSRTLTINGGGSTSFSGVIDGGTGTISVVKTGGGIQTFGGANTYTGKTTILQGILSITGADARLGTAPTSFISDQLTIDGGKFETTASVTLSANRGILIGTSGGTITNSAGLTLPMVISGTGTLTKEGASAVTFSGANTYDGNTIVSAGRIFVTNPGALGSAVGDTQIISGAEVRFDGAAVTGNIAENFQIADGATTTDAASLFIANSATPTLTGNIALTADSVIGVAGGSGVSITNSITGTDRNLSLIGGSGTGAGGTITGVISLGTLGSISKSQGGKWVLSGANVYGGGTTVSAGTLTVNNTSGSGTGSGNVTVLGGLLNGTGSISGAVTVSAGTIGGTLTVGGVSLLSGAAIAPGNSPGTFTTSTLNLPSGAVMNYELGTSSDKIAVTDVAGLTLDSGSNTIALNVTALTGFGPGVYPIIDYNTSYGGSAGSIGVGSAPSGFDYSIGTTGTSINLNVDVQQRTWNVDGDGNWSTATNWLPSGAPNGLGAVANFKTAITSPHIVSIDVADKTVGVVNFDNSESYTIAGPFKMQIVPNGGNGAINVVSGSHAISASIVMNANTDVTVAPADSLNITGDVSGAFDVTKFGGGFLALGSATGNSYTGNTTVSAGTLLLNNSTGSATGTGAVTVKSGGTLGGTGTASGAITIEGGGKVAPGESPGTLHAGNGVTQKAGAVLDYDLSNLLTIDAGDNDLLKVTGDLWLETATININAIDGDVVDGTYELISYTGVLTINGGATVSDIWTIGSNNASGAHTYTFSDATGGEIDLIVAPVPEPASFVILGGVGIGLLTRRRRR